MKSYFVTKKETKYTIYTVRANSKSRACEIVDTSPYGIQAFEENSSDERLSTIYFTTPLPTLKKYTALSRKESK